MNATTSTRFGFLDALRGFAIAGILLVNIPDMTRLGVDAPPAPVGDYSTTQQLLHFLVSTRFVPIFMLLFGVSLVLVRDGARRRGVKAWPVLVRRLIALFGFGLLHSFVYPGEVLREYAAVGLLVLPVVLLAPGWLLLGLGAVGTIGAYAVTGGGILTIPGVLLLGAGAATVGVPARLERADRWVAIAAATLAVVAIPALAWQRANPGDPRFSNAGGIAGGVLALLYIALLSLAWRTPLRALLRAAFDPLGRMAFTNYVTASCLAVPAGLLLGFAQTRDLAPALWLALGILVLQNLGSRLWLHWFAYGPLEWLWRCLTWWRMVPLRRSTQEPAGPADSAYRSASPRRYASPAGSAGS
ncbi:putative membrane protein YeiB [Propionibacteriaceae bacterium ES.041]|uniref:DUF418 domain-containing protein n=1 Tax=Enemella evansiae TaxID=2016499 RepID=UPI000B964813|nr:DUF418 domain-containing protein [Enemella evansiae]OYN96151.1 hypothetical protein CGZ96_12810 [Enemella evansiae]OYO11149.1 hypothetical protein CGZ98_11140 [Enemella evansiae]PFG65372.1 putative membrane protein YeiB [Propionibacteriaceae bacterium ES.041]